MLSDINFSKRDYTLFLVAILCLSAGFLSMGLDPVENGFGFLTLWAAPPLLLVGFILPGLGLAGRLFLEDPLPLKRLLANRPKYIAALLVFITSFAVYVISLEPTASLWDCSEFIASAYKLQIPHTPGTPLFLLIGRIFTMFSFGNPENAALSMNVMSAVFSSSTVAFIFLIIYRLGKKIAKTDSAFFPATSGIAGSLLLAFSDTFWFSAVEAETYGAASFFLVLMVWMGMKAHDFDGERLARWIIFIFYVAGLSFCIHPMCLLAIPTVVVSLYFRNRDLSFKDLLIAIILGFSILLFINRFISVSLFELAFSIDLLMVNGLGFPFYSGAVLVIVGLAGSFIFLQKKFPKLNPHSWALIFLLAGFAPYLMLFLRSQHNPPIDEGNPESLSMIKAYMNRESYGSRPLVFGQYFDADVTDVKVEKKMYRKAEEKYAYTGNMMDYQYDDARSTLLPRMYSSKEEDIEVYRQWSGLSNGQKPTFIHNLKYMFRYQLGHMYFRYLMWNFAGRESDVQHADWLKPWEMLTVYDNPLLRNKARNQYWLLPFVVGLLGLFFQYQKDKKGFAIVCLFFLTTGLVLALYLNSPPNEPRERDYIYVGSFIGFCIWIGLGMQFLSQVMTNILKQEFAVKLITVSFCLALPAWMLHQNFDDHDRSGRTLQVDNARNILNSCAPNAILFTGGDNDTFPLWYVQEVEGFRTDVRVMVLSYFNTDWYINQLRKKYYQSEAFQLTLDPDDYRQYGPNDVLYVQENPSIKGAIDARRYLELLHEEHPALKINTRHGDSYHVLPANSLQLKIDSRSKQNLGLRTEEVSPEIILTTNQKYVEKNALAFVDLLISNDWKRPIYFNFSSMNNFAWNIKPYLFQEGLVFRFLPTKSDDGEIQIDKEKMYENLVNKGQYANLDDDDVYFNYEDYQARIIAPLRQSFNVLAAEFLKTSNKATAEKTMDFAYAHLYQDHLHPSFSHIDAAKIFLSLEREKEAKNLSEMAYNYYFEKVRGENLAQINPYDYYMLKESSSLLQHLGENKYSAEFRKLLTMYK